MGRACAGRAGIAGILLACLLVPGCRAGDGTPSRPDILLVTLDTTRADHLGCYGHPGGTSPRLDRFARSATLFERAYATSSWTLASHASLFTGLLPMQHGAQSLPGGDRHGLGYGVRPLDSSFTTLAEALREAGYRTGAVVAGPALRRELGVAQGFEIYRDELDTPERRFFGKRAEEVTTQALEILARFEGEPFFLFVNYFDPHAPYHPPPPYDASLQKPPPSAPVATLVEALERGAEPVPPSELAPELAGELAAMRSAYEAEIRYMDAQLGRLLEAIDADRTLVIVTSDHGESFGEHYFLSHGAHLYEHNTRVPLLVREPGQSRGRRVSHATQNHRVAGTILAAAGLGSPDGLDLAPLEAEGIPILTEVRRSETNVALLGSFFDRDLQALHDPPWKLIESSGGHTWLFDLEEDPDELHDRSATEPERARAMRARLARIRESRPPLHDGSGPVELRPETAEALRALGYLE